MHENLSQLWTYFADTSCRAYSPLYDRICRAVAADEHVLELIAQSPPRGHVPTVLLAAVHHLILGGLDHPLAAVYSEASDADPGPLFIDVCLSHPAQMTAAMATRFTNTNEVGRSAILGPALTEVARRTDRPLALVDVGCSAGLNLLCDRYRLDYGPSGATGPDDAPVRLRCRVIGGRPPIGARLPAIAARLGIDREPVDIDDEDAVRWLLACTWPDTGRVERTRLALEALQDERPTVLEGDAVEMIGPTLRRLSADVLPVVMTTWAFAYLPEDGRRAFEVELLAASRERDLVWVSGESPGIVEHFAGVETIADEHGLDASVLGLVEYRDGSAAAQLLGFVHPHGSWIDWRL